MATLKNEIGNIYGYLTVIDRGHNDKEGRAQWVCQCKCGNIITVRGKSLRTGNTKSCGCYQKERAAQSNMERVGSLVGQRFGKLTVLSECGFVIGSNGKRRRLYKCLCDCGNYCACSVQANQEGSGCVGDCRAGNDWIKRTWSL